MEKFPLIGKWVQAWILRLEPSFSLTEKLCKNWRRNQIIVLKNSRNARLLCKPDLLLIFYWFFLRLNGHISFSNGA